LIDISKTVPYDIDRDGRDEMVISDDGRGLGIGDLNVCLLGEDREYAECLRWCPYEAIRYVFSEASYTLTPVIDTEKCTGCGACEMACPTKPDKAIVIVPQP